MPNEKRTKRIEKREDRRNKFKNSDPIDNQKLVDLNQKVGESNIEAPTNDTRPKRTAEGFEIAPVSTIKDRKPKKPVRQKNQKNKTTDEVAGNQATIDNIKSETYSKFPEGDVFGIDEKFSTEAGGGGYNESGNSITSGTQLLNSVIEDKDPNNRKTLKEVNEELDAATQFDEVLSDEQLKAKKLQYALDPDEEKLKEIEGLESPYGDKYADISNISVSDILGETDAIVNDGDMTDSEQRSRLEKLLEDANRTPINYGEPALERLGLQDYYPEINTPLQVGTYSGSIVGSNPIFVGGGGVMPVGVIDARKRALERAAAERVKKGEKLKELMLLPSPEQYQDKFHEHGLGILNKYGEMVNWDYAQLMDMNSDVGKEFRKEYAAYDANAKRSMKVQKQYDATTKAWMDDKEGVYLPPQVRDALDRWQDGAWTMDELMDAKELERISNTFDVYDQVTQDAEKLAKDIEPDKFFGTSGMPETIEEWAEFDQEMVKVNSSGGYNVWRTTDFKWVDPARIKDAAEIIASKRHYYNPKESLNDLITLTSAYIGKEAKAKYMSKTEGNRTSVTVNTGNNVAQTEEVRLRANQDSWKKSLFGSVGKANNDKEIATNMTNIMDMSPNLDDEGKFIDGEIRGDIKLGLNENVVLPRTAGALKYIDENTGESYDLVSLQQHILQEKGMQAVDKDAFETQLKAWKKNRKGSGDNDLNLALLNDDGFAGFHFTKEEALILSKSTQSALFGAATKKTYTQKYQDANSQWTVLRVDSDPNAVSGSQPFIEEIYNIYDEDNEVDNVFSGYTVVNAYNLNNQTSDQGSAESYSKQSTTGLNKITDQENVIMMDERNTTNPKPKPKGGGKLN